MHLTFNFDSPNHKDLTGTNKGFENSLLVAFFEGKEVGYLKISNLTHNSFYSLCPTVWDYMKLWKGWVGLNLDGDLWTQVARYKGFGDINKLTNHQASFKKWEEEFTRLQEQTLEFFLNKPFVCYVEVPTEYQNQGIGTALYKKAGELLKEQHLQLHSDSQQTIGAKKIWLNLVDQGLAKFTGKRFIIL